MAPTKPPTPEPNTTSSLPEMRELTDPKTMRALTHPVRLALLESLAIEGPLTATEAGELIGESPTTCSFHFRQLAKYGFVEEAGIGPGRQRHWKAAHVWMNFTDVTEDAEASVAAKSLERLVFERAMARVQSFFATKTSFSKEWQEASDSTEAIIFVTPEELNEFNAACLQLLARFQERIVDPTLRPSDSLPVEVLLFRHPIRLGAVKP
jgi:predicted transcriptional regulator